MNWTTLAHESREAVSDNWTSCWTQTTYLRT